MRAGHREFKMVERGPFIELYLYLPWTLSRC